MLADGTVHVLTEDGVLPAPLRITEVEENVFDMFESEMKVSRRGLPASSVTDPSRWKKIRFRSNETRIHLHEHTCSRHFCEEVFGDGESSCGTGSCGTDEQACGMPEMPSIVDQMLLPSFLKDQYQKRPQLNRASDQLNGRGVRGLSLEKIFNDFVNQGKLHAIRVVKEGKDTTDKLPPGSTHQTLLEWLKKRYSFVLNTEYLTRPHSLSSLTEELEGAMGLPVTGHVYLSSEGIRVFGFHRDPYPVIVFQLSNQGVECLLWNAKVR